MKPNCGKQKKEGMFNYVVHLQITRCSAKFFHQFLKFSLLIHITYEDMEREDEQFVKVMVIIYNLSAYHMALTNNFK